MYITKMSPIPVHLDLRNQTAFVYYAHFIYLFLEMVFRWQVIVRVMMKDCVRARACEVGGWGGGVCVYGAKGQY